MFLSASLCGSALRLQTGGRDICVKAAMGFVSQYLSSLGNRTKTAMKNGALTQPLNDKATSKQRHRRRTKKKKKSWNVKSFHKIVNSASLPNGAVPGAFAVFQKSTSADRCYDNCTDGRSFPRSGP